MCWYVLKLLILLVGASPESITYMAMLGILSAMVHEVKIFILHVAKKQKKITSIRRQRGVLVPLHDIIIRIILHFDSDFTMLATESVVTCGKSQTLSYLSIMVVWFYYGNSRFWTIWLWQCVTLYLGTQICIGVIWGYCYDFLNVPHAIWFCYNNTYIVWSRLKMVCVLSLKRLDRLLTFEKDGICFCHRNAHLVWNHLKMLVSLSPDLFDTFREKWNVPCRGSFRAT